MKRLGFLILFLIFGQLILFAQREVSGTVTDAGGMPIPGVNIVLKGTVTGAITNLDGRFSIRVPGDDAVLVVSFVGYLTQEEVVGNRTVINVTMQEDVRGLEEVVVIGYGTTRKIDVTGSVATLRSDELGDRPTPNFEEGMQGKIPGMEMKKASAEPGGGITVKIRGTNSLLGNNEPLYVIDGFPMNNDNQSRPNGWEGQEPLNLLSNLNPNDIESIQVLKDASATAIYGSRGANGVIIITTKKGHSGRSNVDFEYSHSISKARNPFEFSNVEQYTRIENEFLSNTRGATAPSYRYVAADSNKYGYNTSPAQLAAQYGEGTNWLDEVLKTGSVNNYNISVQGGDERTTYLISGNYYDETGVVLKSDYTKGALRANVSSQVNSRLKVDVNMSGSRYTSDRFLQTGRIIAGGPDRMGVITEAFIANPMTTPETPHLLPNDLLQLNPGQGDVTNFIYNPVRQMNQVDNSEAMNFFLGSVNAELKLLDGLKVIFRGGGNFQSQERINFIPMSTPVGKWWGALGSHSFFDRRNFVYENYANFNRTLGENHTIDATLGYSLEQDRIQTKSMGGSGFNFDLQRIYGWGQLQTPGPMGIGESQRTLASVYGRLFYNFDDRYLITFTARRDGSSVFAENEKFAFFPSVAAAWVLSEEEFMSGVSWVSNLKIRGSYGMVGNQAIGPYQSLATIRNSAGYGAGIVLGGAKLSGLLPNTPANPDLIWETTQQLNIGVDFNALANRFRFSADYYDKLTVDLLQRKPVVSTTGYETFTTNFGEISNKGLELTLGGSPMIGTLKWNTTVSWSYNRNKIEYLGTAADGEALTIALPPSTGIAQLDQVSMFALGEPVGTFWGLENTGLLSQQDIDNGVALLGGLDEPGDMKFLDFNEDGTINDADRHPIGNAQPDFIFGFDNTFTYKNFTLNFFVNGVVGGKVLNLLKQMNETGNARHGGGRHSKEYAENYWTPENTDTRFPRPGGFGGGISTYFLEDATFIRLSNATLNYRIPTEKLGWSWVRNASVYVRGSNLFLITDYSGFDPEGQFTGQSDANQNIDLGNYPRPVTVEFGVKLGL